MKKFYSFAAIVAVALMAFAAKAQSTGIVQWWNFSDWDQASYEVTTVIDNLTVYAGDKKAVVIDGNKKTIDGEQYTQRLKFGGKTDWDGNEPKDRALAFDVEGPTTVEIALTSSSSSGTGRFLTVYDGDKTNPVDEGYEAPTDGVEVCTFEYTGEEPTTLIIGVDGGINLYFVKATTLLVGGDEIPEIDSFSNVPDFEDGTEVKLAMDVTVVFATEALSIIYDGVSYQGAKFNDLLNAGDVVKAGWTAECTNGVLFATSEITVDGTKALPEPTPIEDAQYIPNWQYVHFDQVYVPTDGVDGEYPFCEAVFEEGSVVFLMTDMIGLDITSGTYTIEGFWYEDYMMDEDPVQNFIVTKATPVLEAITSLNAIIGDDIPQGTEVVMGCELTVVAYISDLAAALVYDGEVYAMMGTEQVLEAGDVIAPNFNAYVIGSAEFYTEDELTVVSQGTVPTPGMVAPESIAYSMITPNQYIELEDITIEEGLSADEDVVVFTVEEEDYFALNVNMIDKAAGTYNLRGFWYDMLYTKAFVILEVTDASTGINGVAAEAANAEYFNLNGVKVSSPEAGNLYIRVANGRAAKVIK